MEDALRLFGIGGKEGWKTVALDSGKWWKVVRGSHVYGHMKDEGGESSWSLPKQDRGGRSGQIRRFRAASLGHSPLSWSRC